MNGDFLKTCLDSAPQYMWRYPLCVRFAAPWENGMRWPMAHDFLDWAWNSGEHADLEEQIKKQKELSKSVSLNAFCVIVRDPGRIWCMGPKNQVIYNDYVMDSSRARALFGDTVLSLGSSWRAIRPNPIRALYIDEVVLSILQGENKTLSISLGDFMVSEHFLIERGVSKFHVVSKQEFHRIYKK